METRLVHFDTARREIELARNIDEVKNIRDKAEALRAYAKQAGESLEMQNTCAEIKLRAERKAGELLSEQVREPRETDRVLMSDDMTSKKPKLLDLGISRNQSSSWQKIADIPEAKFEQHIAETKEKKEELTTASTLRLADELEHKPHVSHATGNNEWYTPSEYIESVRKVMGKIDLDPASSELANTIVKAAAYYDIDDNGLNKDWIGKVWMNPPYSADLVTAFITKLVSEYEKNHVEEAIILVNNATETRWFKSLVEIASAICFPVGRVKYWGPNATSGAPLQGQAFVYIGENTVEFGNEFNQHGWLAFFAGRFFP